MSGLLEQLLASPELAIFREKIDTTLRAEAERRQKFYEEITPELKAEFINGQVVLHSPATVQHHRVRQRIHRLLDRHVLLRGLGEVFGEKVLVTLTRNDYEPDILFYHQRKASLLQPGQLLCPAPDFVIEILSPSTARNDRVVKFQDYAAHGVPEYWIVDPDAEAVEQFILESGTYVLRQKVNDGTLHAVVVPGFTMPVRAAFDDAANLAALRQID